MENNKQFLRHYGLYISSPTYAVYGGNSEQIAREITDPLRITFEIDKTITREPNRAKIVIYNLSPDTENEIIKEGTQVTLLAGYENPGIIFKGQIFQPIRGVKNSTDYYLKLIALDGDAYLNLGFMSGTIASRQTRRKIASQVLRDSNLKLSGDNINELSEENAIDGSTNTQTERAKVIFGRPSKYLSNLSKMGNSTFYVDDNEGKFFNPKSESGRENAFVINAETGMIDHPRQIDWGIEVTCFLNPAIKLGSFIKIDNKSVIMEESDFSYGSYQSRLLNSDGIYRVIRIHYSGDYMGENWYCTLTAVTQGGLLPAMMSGSYGALIL